MQIILRLVRRKVLLSLKHILIYKQSLAISAVYLIWNNTCAQKMAIKTYENNDNITNFYMDNYNWLLHTNIQYLQISKSELIHVTKLYMGLHKILLLS